MDNDSNSEAYNREVLDALDTLRQYLADDNNDDDDGDDDDDDDDDGAVIGKLNTRYRPINILFFPM